MSKKNESLQPSERPYLTRDMPGIGGEIKGAYEDFIVEEIGAYEPSGKGGHHFLFVEKRGLDGKEFLKILSETYGVDEKEIGTAGTKDRVAVTRQWVSLPVRAVTKEPEPGKIGADLEVLKVSRHGNKLKTGHLKGNRFEVRISRTEAKGEELAKRVEAIGEVLRRQGLPNYYGMQRFGGGGSNLKAGLKWLETGHPPRSRLLRSMGASALQSEVFNRVLKRRLEEGSWKRALEGDIFEKVESGGKFWVEKEELPEVQGRIDSGELSITGPMPGSKIGLVGSLEREVVESMGLAEEDFSKFGRLGRGARRALTVHLEKLSWEIGEEEVRLRFWLPAGSYATVVVREFTKI